MSILGNIDKTLINTDVFLIKQKLFKALCYRGTATCNMLDMYYLMQEVKLDISEIETLLKAGICKEHPICVHLDPAYYISNDAPLISNFEFCKKFIENPNLYYEHFGVDGLSYYNVTSSKRTTINMDALSCVILFNTDTQEEYKKYNKNFWETSKFKCFPKNNYQFIAV